MTTPPTTPAATTRFSTSRAVTASAPRAETRPGRTVVNRGRLVAAEAGLGCVAAGIAVTGLAGYALAAAGTALLTLTVLRIRGRRASGHLLRLLQRDAFATPPPAVPPRTMPRGLARTLFPALEVTDASDRNGATVGVIHDGRGYAAVLEVPTTTGAARISVNGLIQWLGRDPARPAAVQVVVEQFAPPGIGHLRHFAPARSYRSMPQTDHPVAARAWLVLRHEPLQAPEVAEARGGAAAGARAGVVAATARLRAALRSDGLTTEPLDAARTARLLDDLGDPSGTGRLHADHWSGTEATHSCLTAHLATQADWGRLLRALAPAEAARVVTALTLSNDGPDTAVRTIVRLVSPRADIAWREHQRLVSQGALHPLTGQQHAGLVATLPLAHPPRSLVDVTGFTIGAHTT
ncbi:type VII secretion protein EccE [Streptomyces sp. CB03238]|uniref:type VII secretion protein EccE n=1 Tax=Streptomyces sp. CB03238 TaxID=1907777 RepID=UPI000A0FFD92|nr:type VII secretion protein EccE [Streptomyces sp. CB03238]ORT60541.1 hypothetical protein BKD26_09265 [Streptomyces sp. CB03238]